MMKVALVHWRLFNVGGLETRLRNYLDYFHSRGDDITLFCYKQSADFHVPEGVKIVRLHLGAMPKPYRLWYFNNKLQRIFNVEEFDFSLSLGRTSQQEACLAPGDHLGFLKALKRRGRKPRDIVQVNLDKLSFTNSRVIFPCSDLVKQNLLEMYHVPEDKMCTLYPPLNTQKFNPSYKENKQALREQFNMHPEKTTFVVVSTAHRRKGIPLLLKLFKELTHLPVELKIAGKPRVRTKLPNVEFIGYVKNSNELFASADFSIHPAIYEPFGQVISESLACGTPVLISPNTGWSTNLPANYGKVVSDFELESWKNAVEEVLKSSYAIDSDFAERYELKLELHMKKMLERYFDDLDEEISIS